MSTTMSKYGASINRPLSEIVGLSTDVKPTDKVEGVPIQNGSTFFEMDTNKKYRFDIESKQWNLVDGGGGGGSATLIDKTITANGTYLPADDEATAYSKIVANVPNTYTAQDEGKVVDNGELVAQTAMPSSITQNGAVNTTMYNSVTVDVAPQSIEFYSTMKTQGLMAQNVIGDTWSTKTWSGLMNFNGGSVWTDGDNIYYSSSSSQYVLDKTTSTWSAKTWSGLTSFSGGSVWTDGDNIYYSSDSSQYVLDKSTSTWSAKTWNGFTSFNGMRVWTDGDNIYYSYSSRQYVLDKSTSTWSEKTWNGLSMIDGSLIWTDGDNIYYSSSSSQYVLDKTTSTWSAKTWSGLTSFSGGSVWTDGDNIYYSSDSSQYVLDKSTSTWSTKTWSGLSLINGAQLWTDGDNIYHSYNSYQYYLPITKKPFPKITIKPE